MKKSNLKNGYLVVLRDNTNKFVVGNGIYDSETSLGEPISNYNEDLTHMHNINEDITEVYDTLAGITGMLRYYKGEITINELRLGSYKFL